MHSLHCLNAIRKEVDWEHYGNSRHAKYLSAEARRIHVGKETVSCARQYNMYIADWLTL